MKNKKLLIATGAVAGIAAGLAIGSKILNKKEESTPEITEKGNDRILPDDATFYEKYVKRGCDIVMSIGGIVVLSPVIAVSSLLVYKENPGNVIFKQKRVGINKTYFYIHKLRSMRLDTPDIPTHLMENPDQYILKTGKIFRKWSIDELYQLFDILRGRMSIVGPRPALWNQDDLVAERDKYQANDVRPGLTGWAQINGRDELEIPVKAKLDGEYCKELRKSSLSGLKMDCKCFLGTIRSVLSSEGVVEGGTGSMNADSSKRNYIAGCSEKEMTGNIGFGETVEVDRSATKKVLITGAGSYIGQSFINYAQNNYPDNFVIHEQDMLDGSWRDADFSGYDIIYHVAGIAHADVGNVSEDVKENYYAVNTDLALETAKKAKEEGVKTFIFMSSMIIYGDSAPYGREKVVDAKTVPISANFYGDSKLQADVAVRALADDDFKVIVLRPPMIYGKDSKGNYPILSKLAKKLPVFPDVHNERSMLHIDNLCEFLCQVMLIKDIEQWATVLIPQNAQWTNTAEMVQEIAKVSNKKLIKTRLLAPAVAAGSKVPGKIGGLIDKAFGNSCYAHEMSVYPGIDYQIVGFKESIQRTEKKDASEAIKTDEKTNDDAGKKKKKHILVVSQYFYPEQFRINDMCQEWVKRGYKVSVITGIPNYPMGKTFEGYGLCKKRHEIWNEVEIYRIPLIPRGTSKIGMAANYVSFMVSGIIAGLIKNIHADLVFSFEVSPMTQVLTGITFAKKLGVPHYLYVQDLWPENVITVAGISNPKIIKPIDKMVDYIYKNSDEIFATSPSFVEAICNRKVKVPRKKVHYWPQYAEEIYRPIEKEIAKKEAQKYGIPDDDSFKIIFTGNIGKAQGLQVLPQTAELLKNENVKFVVVGDGRYLEEFLGEIDRRNVKDLFVMVPRQPAEAIPILLSACDAAFVSFANDELWAKTIPAKLQSYMACGMPIVASAQGETKRIIEEADCGMCAGIGDSGELSVLIKQMLNMDLSLFSDHGRSYFEKNFEKTMLMDQIDEFFNQK